MSGIMEDILLDEGFGEHPGLMNDLIGDIGYIPSNEDMMKMEFPTEEHGHHFFNRYAKYMGFSVRKDKVLRDKVTGVVIFRRFLCSKAGLREAKHKDRQERKRRQRPLTRTNCPCYFSIQLDKSSGNWLAHDFEPTHNHKLAVHDEVVFLRSHRNLDYVHRDEVDTLIDAGIRKHKIMEYFMVREGGYHNVGFTVKDLYNYAYHDLKEKINEGDAQTVLNYMENRYSVDPEFFFRFEKDVNGHLTSLFWADSQSRLDYQYFGDVVLFDTTYRTNRYSMPFVPFVGVNHHRRTIVFGCGIVSDETVESFTWLLKSLLLATKQQHPKSVITDGDNAMRIAIENVLPNTVHRLCSWHIQKNMCRHINKPELFSALQNLIFEVCMPEDFERKWEELLKNYGIKTDHFWMTMMYHNRMLWAEAYLHGKLFLGIRSTQRSESLNANLHLHLDRSMYLDQLVNHYELCVSQMRRIEAEDDCKASQSTPVTTCVLQGIQMDAVMVYTPSIFYLVQYEIENCWNYSIVDRLLLDESHRYTLSSKETSAQYIVDCHMIDGELHLFCSCLKLKSVGIPCRHMFALMKHLQLSHIPLSCIWSRWTKTVKYGFLSDRRGTLQPKKDFLRYRNLVNIANRLFYKVSKSEKHYTDLLGKLVKQLKIIEEDEIDSSEEDSKGPYKFDLNREQVLDPLIVKTKGAPKKRLKNRTEVRIPRCSVCRKPGHRYRTCPKYTKDDNNQDGDLKSKSKSHPANKIE